jgi:hypothetical protein
MTSEQLQLIQWHAKTHYESTWDGMIQNYWLAMLAEAREAARKSIAQELSDSELFLQVNKE